MSKTVTLDIPESPVERALKQDREHIMQFFKYDHLPVEKQAVSRPFGELAEKLVAELPRNPERTVALRKLLEAKDAAVRAGFAVGVLLALLLPGLAFAADAAPTPAQEFLGRLSGPLLDLVAAAAVAALGMLTAYLRAKSQESKATGAGVLLSEAVRAAVHEIDVTLKPKLQAAFADGVLTDKEKLELKNAALELVKQRLPASALAGARSVFGEFLDTFLAGKLEQAVLEKKNLESPTPVPPTP